MSYVPMCRQAQGLLTFLLVPLGLCQDRLSGRKTCHRYSEWRAAYIVQTNLITESDALRIPTMLAADTYLQPGVRLATLFHSDPYEPAHPIAVKRLKWI